MGLVPYLYDESQCPSGMVGGEITRRYPMLAAKGIVLKMKEDTCDYRYLARIQDGFIETLRYGAEPEAGECHISIAVETARNSDYYDGTPPADNLNPSSVRTFLNLTHEAYKKALSGNLKGPVAGIFTDEPNFCDLTAQFSPGQPWLPWTSDLAERFIEKRGYDLVPELPYLFFEGERAPQIRHDYWRTLTELFSESYFKQIQDWCAENGILSCGHLLFENTLASQCRACGAAMPHYRYLDIPGVDILGEQTEEYMTVKQCTSVANQFSRPSLSEIYGCSGWQLDFEGQKWIWDWLSVMGIDLRIQHLLPYTIKGRRKRDFPPFLGYQNDWWRYGRVMEDYCARMSVCTASGTPCREILVLHPQSSVWTKCGSQPDEDLWGHFISNMGWGDKNILDINAEYDEINRFAKALMLNQCDFDFGDEILIGEAGKVESGTFRIENARYSLVIVPKVESLFYDTCLKLKQFADQGGRVIWVEKLPDRMEGKKDPLAKKLFPDAEIVRDYAEAVEVAKKYRQVRVTDKVTLQTAALLTGLRKTEFGYVLLAVNNDRLKTIDCRIALPEVGQVTEYAPLNNTKKSIVTNEKMEFDAKFAPADAKVFLLEVGKPPQVGVLHTEYHDVHESLPTKVMLPPEASFKRTMPNVLTLDQCQYQTTGVWSEQMDIWRAQRAVRKEAGFIDDSVMRYKWVTEKKPGIPLALRVRFFVKDIPETELLLALEEAQHMDVYVNGELCELTEGYFLDKSISCVALKNIRMGENELLLRCMYTRDLELEAMYLLGDFAVDSKGWITAEPLKLKLGDWVLQGYPNYPGSMIYQYQFVSDQEQVYLHLGAWSGTMIAVRVNGGAEQFVPWKAVNDIPLAVQKGNNTLEIEVVGSNRNMLGPLHQPYQRCSRISCLDFFTEGAEYSLAHITKAYGLLGQIYLD